MSAASHKALQAPFGRFGGFSASAGRAVSTQGHPAAAAVTRQAKQQHEGVAAGAYVIFVSISRTDVAKAVSSGVLCGRLEASWLSNRPEAANRAGLGGLVAQGRRAARPDFAALMAELSLEGDNHRKPASQCTPIRMAP